MRRSRTVIMSLAVIIVAGIVTYANVPKEAEPDLNIPIVYVSMKHDGISPEDAERLLVRPMEQEIRNIEGIEELIGSAYEGGASIQIEFDAGTDTDIALQDVRAKVDVAKAKLPNETEEPIVMEIKFSRFDPMLVLNLAGDVPERTLTVLARDLKEKIEGISGVLEVNLVGVREELMEVVVDPLARHRFCPWSIVITAWLPRVPYIRAKGDSRSRFRECSNPPKMCCRCPSRRSVSASYISRMSPRSAERIRTRKATRALTAVPRWRSRSYNAVAQT
jgi:hypothetical protein